jgi:DnaJ domain
MHTIASLKAEYKTLSVAKTAHKIKAASWQALADKLNGSSAKASVGKAKQSVKKVKPLGLNELKTLIYQHFSVKNTVALRKSQSFCMAIDGMDALNFALKPTWEKLYRQFIGILPHEMNEQGDTCINGIDIFKYFRPWQIFGLNGKTASAAEIKAAYHNLSRIYHPDVPSTGNAAMFDRINNMYKSISAGA